MTTFRPHRGTLLEAMRECVEVASRDELERRLAPMTIVAIEPYGYDDRIGWQTYIVTARAPQDPGPWVVGFTNGPL